MRVTCAKRSEGNGGEESGFRKLSAPLSHNGDFSSGSRSGSRGVLHLHFDSTKSCSVLNKPPGVICERGGAHENAFGIPTYCAMVLLQYNAKFWLKRGGAVQQDWEPETCIEWHVQSEAKKQTSVSFYIKK